ncbi:MAG: hypothetical protein IJ390_11515 [Lachnospiraceae bacterium]|nr:hypothetical protein [Lachnospiraceae bacterium]
MNKRNNLKWKLQKYAIPNLTMYLIICYAIGYVLQIFSDTIYYYLVMDPFLVLKGQVWRLVTWILIPPESSNIFFMLIMSYLYYSLGNLLERIWGTWKYNVYIFSGILFMILGAFVLCAYCAVRGVQYTQIPGYYIVANQSLIDFGQFSTYYINMAIFLACAASIPDVQVLLMFVFPIKVKWLGIVYGVMLLLECIQGGFSTVIVVVFSLLNFLIFFIQSKGNMHLNSGQVKMRRDFKQKMRRAENQTRGVTKHKCAICGRTELDGDDLEFRFCSKCNGNYEYCQYHLFTHEHVK